MTHDIMDVTLSESCEMDRATRRRRRSPRLVFPKRPPYENVHESRVSKDFARLDKSYPEFDVVRQNDPNSNLALLRVKYAQTEKALKHKRKDLLARRCDLDGQWTDLDAKERSLRESFEHFDTFIRENNEKRERAMKRVREDVNTMYQRQAAIDRLLDMLEHIREAKKKMDGKIKQYRLYEEYLDVVVGAYKEFNSAQDVMDRYLSLLHSKNQLGKMQQEYMGALEDARADMMKLADEKSFEIMGLNNQIASLQARYENASIKSLECESLVLQIKNSAVSKMNEIDEVKNSMWNLCAHISRSKNHPLRLRRDNLEGQMVFIKRTLTELAQLNLKLLSKSRTTMIKKSK